MKLRFLSKWSIIILSIFINLLSIQVSSVNSRSNKTLQTENFQAEFDFDDDVNDEDQQIGATNDYEATTDIINGLFSTRNKEKRNDNSSFYSRKHNNGIVKRAADLDLAEFELEKVEKNVENEIINLKKRYNNNKEIDHKRGINRNHRNPSAPRLMKIRVETYEIDNEPVADQSISSKRRDRSSSLVITNVTAPPMMEKTTTHRIDIEEKNKTRILIENAIQEKIDAIKTKVKRLIANEQKHNNIRKNNARFIELRKVSKLDRRSLARRKSSKSMKITASKLKKETTSRSTLKNQQHKLNTRRIANHHDAKKDIQRQGRTSIASKIASSVNVDPHLPKSSSKSEVPGSQRLTRRLRKPPDNSQSLHRTSRRLRKPSNNLEKHHRPSRRLRKPPESKVTLSKKVQTDKKSRHVTNAQNIMTNHNSLSYEKLHSTKPVIRSDQHTHFSPAKQKVGKKSKHKRKEQKINHPINNNSFGQRDERSVATLLDPTNSDQAAGSISQNMVNSHDINSHLVSEYSDTFGGFPSDSDDTSLQRYKRVKRS